MARVLAFDFGLKRIGIAVTDPLQIIANSLETLPRKEIFNFIKKYCAAEDVEAVVVGYPFSHGHSENEITRHIDGFILKLNEFDLRLDNEEDFALIQLKMKDLEIEK